ncbi:MAG: response regulator transcription factor [Burkholderiaceae bacterium]|nr:response regulator transcription factor [Burkholderiaceae bacterium]
MKPTTILLVDDHALVRIGIKLVVEQRGSHKVVAEAANNAEALVRMAELRPDVVITDISMGVDCGLDLICELKRLRADVSIIVVSMHDSETMVADALKLGVVGYVLKDAAARDLETALNTVARGEIFLSEPLPGRMIQWFLKPPAKPDNPLESLTAREREIFTMIVNGHSTKEVAYQLELSGKTVAGYRMQIMKKLDIRDRVGMVLFAVEHGLVAKPGAQTHH